MVLFSVRKSTGQILSNLPIEMKIDCDKFLTIL